MDHITLDQAQRYTLTTIPHCSPAYSDLLSGKSVEEQLRFFSVRLTDHYRRINMDVGDEVIEDSVRVVPLTECRYIGYCVVDQGIIVGVVGGGHFLSAPGKPEEVYASETHDHHPGTGITAEEISVHAELLFTPEGTEYE